MNPLIFMTILLLHCQFNFAMSPQKTQLPPVTDQQALDAHDQYMTSFYEKMRQLDEDQPEEYTETFTERKARLSEEKSDKKSTNEIYNPFLDQGLQYTQSLLDEELQDIRNNPYTKYRKEKATHLRSLLDQQQRTNNFYMHQNKNNALYTKKEIEHVQQEEKITKNLHKLALAQEFNKKSIHAVFTDSETLRRANMFPGVSLRKSPTHGQQTPIAEVDREKWSIHKFSVTWNLANAIDNITLLKEQMQETLSSINNQASLLEAYKTIYKKHQETLCAIKKESAEQIANREKKWGLFSHRITKQMNQQNALQMHQKIELQRQEEATRREEKNRIENERHLAEKQKKQEELEKKEAQQKARTEQSNRDKQRAAALQQEKINKEKSPTTSQHNKQKKSPCKQEPKARPQEDNFEAILAEEQAKNKKPSTLTESILDTKESHDAITDSSSTDSSIETTQNNPEDFFYAWRNEKIQTKIKLLEDQKKAALDLAKAHKKPAHNKIAIIKKYDDLIRHESQFVNADEKQIIDQLQRLQEIMNIPLVSQAGVHSYELLLEDWKLIQNCLSKNNFNLSWYLHTQPELYKDIKAKYQLFQKTKKSLVEKKEELEETIKSINRGHIKYAQYQDQITQVIQKLNVLDLLQEFNATVNFTLDPTEKKESVAVAISSSTNNIKVLDLDENDDMVFATQQLEAMHLGTSSSELKIHTTQEINKFNRFLFQREIKIKQQQDSIEEQVRNYTKNLSKQKLTISQRQEKREYFRNKLTYDSQFGSQLEMQIFQYFQQCNFLIDIPYEEVDDNKIDELYTATITTFHQLQRVLQENGQHFNWYTALYNEFIQNIRIKYAALENEMEPYKNTSDIVWERVEAYKEELKSIPANSPSYKKFKKSLQDHETIYKKLHILNKFNTLNETLDYPFLPQEQHESKQTSAKKDSEIAKNILDKICLNTGRQESMMRFIIYGDGNQIPASGLDTTAQAATTNKSDKSTQLKTPSEATESDEK